MITISIDQRELATILAALRLWQSSTDDEYRRTDFIAADDGIAPLDDDEIDWLCEHLNTSQGYVSRFERLASNEAHYLIQFVMALVSKSPDCSRLRTYSCLLLSCDSETIEWQE